MSSFTEFALEFLDRMKIPPKCSICGNPHISELALTGKGKLICRQDIDNIREACGNRRDGWRVLGPDGHAGD